MNTHCKQRQRTFNFCREKRKRRRRSKETHALWFRSWYIGIIVDYISLAIYRMLCFFWRTICFWWQWDFSGCPCSTSLTSEISWFKFNLDIDRKLVDHRLHTTFSSRIWQLPPIANRSRLTESLDLTTTSRSASSDHTKNNLSVKDCICDKI